MPELPEVQTIVNELGQNLPGRKIISCHIIRNSIIHGPPDQFSKGITDRIIRSIERAGKYILINLSSGDILLAHLRMTGKFILLHSGQAHQPHDRVVFGLDDQRNLIFSDVRCFGTLELIKARHEHKGLNRLGLDPWDRKLTGAYLFGELKNRHISIKSALLDQTLIAGLGNIYASEILFHSRINPATPSNRLSKERLSAVIRHMRKVLTQALVHNGTSISDYRRIDEKQGMFQNFLKVYGKADQTCVNCSSRIVKIVQNQRSTFLCPKCQR